MTDRASGVRNLRAMFETQSAASSPEPRGRSPADTTSSADGPVRPASKVRASFVSVGPSGHIPKDTGTTKGTADGLNTPTATHRDSFSVSRDLSGVTTELKKVVIEEKEARQNSDAVPEAIPEQAVESREASISPPPIREPRDDMPNLGTIMKGSSFPESGKPETEDLEPLQITEPARETPTDPEPEQKPEQELEPEPELEPEQEPEPQQEQEQGSKPETAIEEGKGADAPSSDSPGDNPDKPVTAVQEEASLKPGDPTDQVAVSGGEALPPPTEALPSKDTAEPALEASKLVENKVRTNGTTATTNGRAAQKKPPAISTIKASTAKASSSKSPLPKSPGVARLPKTPTTPKPAPSPSFTKSPAPTKAQPKPTAKEPAKVPAPKPGRASLRAPTSSTTTTASATTKTKAPAPETKKPAVSKPTTSSAPKAGTTTSPGGFKKPKPRSPTRPVRLPSHLIAPTAASAAKHDDDATAQKVVKKPSIASRPPPKTAAPTRTPRTSLVPSTAPGKRPDSRASTRGAPDEGFLARMMRPTASSASKTHDKPASPPRKGASVKASSKPQSHDGAMAKGKKKVEEAASKIKAVVSNGHNEEHDTEHDTEPINTAETTVAKEAAVEEPDEQVESAVELQTPSFEEQAIR
ncbi:hypothetical protein BDV95DRAFT_582791 [Massariosphaeria phaeospora]|uniref:Mucin-7 n=1 Tax=Massariosphaeria phaeospora TaxID=100035 RepID=A0A7C8I7J3_9PLEO|nr:hypothetical protein BDV95DRAFT_582791 [Massariosphaeria phaeospora]